MKPLFTVHAGEFLVDDEIERKFPRINVWIPAKDIGVDLLASDKKNKTTVSLQVKFSRDYLVTHIKRVAFQKEFRACGWWTPTRQQIEKSPAEYWIFVLVGFANRSRDFIIVKPDELLKRFDAIHGKATKKFQSGFWVTEKGKCWETRGLANSEKDSIAEGTFKHDNRDFTVYLNNWGPISALDT